MTIPEELVNRFRTVAGERLDRIEASWSSVLRTFDDESSVQIQRELHTLKGESKMLGFSDVNLVCHRLEDLLEVARARGYAVDEDFDLTVNMAIRFMAMLVRKKVGAQLGGIDLPGFLRQIDSVLAESRAETPARATTGAMVPLRAPGRQLRVPAALRDRLEPVAAEVFIEYAVARRARRDRLRSAWGALRELVGLQRAMIGPGQLEKHHDSAVALARELGKTVNVVLDVESVEATAEILTAIETALLHLLRNAVDHGIEATAKRRAAGKPPNGTLRLRCHVQDEQLQLTIEDDGAGVSLDAVRERAIELGLVGRDVVDIGDRWLDLICQPGFTTRSVASEVSGRGAGLDAGRAAIVDVGGTFTATTQAGTGTTWRIAIPLPKLAFDAYTLRVPGLPFPVALDRSWRPAEATASGPVFDLAYQLGIIEQHANAKPHFFTRGETTIGLLLEREPTESTVRRIVARPAAGAYEVVLFENVEGLLVQLERVR